MHIDLSNKFFIFCMKYCIFYDTYFGYEMRNFAIDRFFTLFLKDKICINFLKITYFLTPFVS